MLRAREVAGLVALLVVALWAVLASADQTIGGACGVSSIASSAQSTNGNNVVCISGAWQYPIG